MKKKYKLALSISGGIDSSASAFLIKKNIFYLENFFIKNWTSNEEKKCSYKIDLIHVKNVCSFLKIKLNILNYSQFYWDNIFRKFLMDLKIGLTPNPDILCNKKFKFNVFLYYIIFFLKFDFLLTGHYSGMNFNKKKAILCTSFDKTKNQNYFLFSIKNNIKKYIIFPLINYLKKKVKNVIKNVNFINFNKKSSTGICFIGEKNFKIFITKYIKMKEGLILDENNNFVAKHDGLFFYTIGERINIKSLANIVFYVFKKNYKKNILYITNKNILLYSKLISIKNLSFKINKSKSIFFSKIRHSLNVSVSLIYVGRKNTIFFVFFKNLQKSITPGQYIAFYKGNICIGGAVIDKIHLIPKLKNV